MLIMDGIRRDHIEGTAKIVIQQPQDAVDHIVDVNPGQILPTITHRTAESEAKRRNHFPQNPALRRQDNAGTQQADAGLVALRTTGNLFPAGAKLMRKFVVRRLIFSDDNVAQIAVIARGGAGYQHRGRRSAGMN
ncbi:Uncharacterised protein [Salmonella enterica subsp. enterica serovar Bovismorbificans]|uniref:Uncharacterized protein n=1 Tax=Salmonella enterica subsp. enterica serovar Bovismorbificans TaxID=58097 RepID=A0A655E4I3_SALET|nr:Uncharacterised protein [Salmonella enterica subsp. enterica serovar Bovismorbificans]CNV01393.1 Uncharacterised protein [Salmonella enterica subsp. enterica serovar Bovismorbificans]